MLFAAVGYIRFGPLIFQAGHDCSGWLGVKAMKPEFMTSKISKEDVSGQTTIVNGKYSIGLF
jgi:hypothetical protein